MTTELAPSFPARLKAATQADHEAAESSGFITSLLQGQSTAVGYVRLLSQYAYIYAALEAGARQLRASRPDLAGVLDERLDRMTSLQADLAQLRPAHGFAEIPTALESTQAYVARLQETAQTDAVRFMAHHYLRYLGDLSGGQIIGRLVGRHYAIPGEALTMWDFAGIDKLKPYKDDYRGHLETAVDSTEAENDFIHEAALGFRLNRALFEELARTA